MVSEREKPECRKMIKSEVGAHTSEKSVDAVLCSSLSQLRLKEEHDGVEGWRNIKL